MSSIPILLIPSIRSGTVGVPIKSYTSCDRERERRRCENKERYGWGGRPRYKYTRREGAGIPNRIPYHVTATCRRLHPTRLLVRSPLASPTPPVFRRGVSSVPPSDDAITVSSCYICHLWEHFHPSSHVQIFGRRSTLSHESPSPSRLSCPIH